MKFFDDKEEVLDIQLTPFGRYQLSVGKWKPVYYAFFDDNILYDSEYAGLTESQDQVEARIQENTPQLHTQHVFSGRETDFKKEVSQTKAEKNKREEDKIKIQSNAEKFYSLAAPLGTSEYGIKEAPRWSIRVLQGRILNTQREITGSFRNLEIPQVDVTLTYKYFVNGPAPRGEPTPNSVLSFNADNSYLSLESEEILLDLQELNVPFDNENYEIEVFAMPESGSEKNMNQLYFHKKPQQIVNDILVANPPANLEDFEYDESYVEYYFDIKTDEEISPRTIANSVEKLKSRGIYVDKGSVSTLPSYNGPATTELYRDVSSTEPGSAPVSEELVVCADDDVEKPPRAKLTRRRRR